MNDGAILGDGEYKKGSTLGRKRPGSLVDLLSWKCLWGTHRRCILAFDLCSNRIRRLLHVNGFRAYGVDEVSTGECLVEEEMRALSEVSYRERRA